ncbi:hypothetical protein BJ742DRAFT_842962 [Cladochytrium replicatum]|nr:hypothetical protein BJ742DRAFT_842962 [Cladochytrium replicatum]
MGRSLYLGLRIFANAEVLVSVILVSVRSLRTLDRGTRATKSGDQEAALSKPPAELCSNCFHSSPSPIITSSSSVETVSSDLQLPRHIHKRYLSNHGNAQV